MTAKEQYIAFCQGNQLVPLFMRAVWLDVVCPAWDAAITYNGDSVSGIWAFPVEKKWGVSLLRTPGLTPYLGPWVVFPSDLKAGKRERFEYDVISSLMQQAPDAQVWHLAVAPGIRQAGLFRSHGLSCEVQQTFRLDLTPEEDVLLTGMHESTRKNIRQAQQAFTIERSAAGLPDLFAFHRQTLLSKGRPTWSTLAELTKLNSALQQAGASAVWSAKSEQGVEAVIWQVWDQTTSYYLMGGQNPEGQGYRAMTLLLWNAITFARQNGQVIFDFEGSMDPGVERFFRNFGGTKELYLVLRKNKSLLWKLKQFAGR